MIGQSSGSVVIIILVVVSLFAALNYAFMDGTRTSVAWLMDEEQQAETIANVDCALHISAANKRLEARGCEGLISALPDGSNPLPGAPSDGSCSVYHPNGGGVKNCQNLAMPLSDPCVGSPSIGTVCADGAIYVGDYSGNRYFIAATNEPTTLRHKTTSTGVLPNLFNSMSGEANTNAMEAEGLALYPAAAACRARGPQWFLPSIGELSNFWPALSSWGVLNSFWSSNQVCCTIPVAHTARTIGSAAPKASLRGVRCMRRE
jgi:hypothetical protein